jgi:hypothetical protein
MVGDRGRRDVSVTIAIGIAVVQFPHNPQKGEGMSEDFATGDPPHRLYRLLSGFGVIILTLTALSPCVSVFDCGPTGMRPRAVFDRYESMRGSLWADF